MIKNSFAIILIFVSVSTFAQEDVPKSSWVSSPVKIDGNAREWKLPLQFYDDGTKLFYAFANDDKNLYICFQVPGDMSQMKIMQAGMVVSLTSKGKHKVSVTFPLAQQSAPAPDDTNSQQNMDRKNRRTSFILQNTLMEVKGFTTRNGIISINDSSGINVAMNWDENDKLTYEIAVPFKEWLGADYSIADAAKDISMDVTINALKQSHHGGGGESGMSGRGRMSGGGMHHQQNADTDQENQLMPGEYKYNLYEKTKLKQKFILAQSSDAK